MLTPQEDLQAQAWDIIIGLALDVMREEDEAAQGEEEVVKDAA